MTDGDPRAPRVHHLLELLADLEEGRALRGDVHGIAGLGIPALPRLADLHLEAPEAANLDALAFASARAPWTSKIVLTTISVSFFEMCGVRSATASMRPLFVISLLASLARLLRELLPASRSPSVVVWLAACCAASFLSV
jgi:hypothetical protein